MNIRICILILINVKRGHGFENEQEEIYERVWSRKGKQEMV